VGEFDARGPTERGSEVSRERRTFSVFANSYFDLRKGAFSDDIEIVDYDPTWPDQFHEMASWLRDRLGPGTALRVEHYGSTAIPNMPAKPVIDILVQVSSFEEGKRNALPLLNDETWEYWWYSGHMVFLKRRASMGERTHHIHMAPQVHPVWKGITFRDYLRSHPEEAARYAVLKRRLAEVHRGDREGYTQAKAFFVNEITRKATGNP